VGSSSPNGTMTFGQAVLEGTRAAMREHGNVVVIGQGVDDFKGTFGTTLGLADEFGADRVYDTPLAEEGMTGVAIGAALNGLYPIQTHIRADFALLAMNQIVNHAASYRYMFGGQFEVPMLIRMVIGRSWGQGAQHSKSLQAVFGHIPGLTVIMPASAESVMDSYRWVIANHRGPVISLEHRLIFDVRFNVRGRESNNSGSPLRSRVARAGRDVTIVATSIMVLEALRAAEHVRTAAGIEAEVIDLHCVSHPSRETILDSVHRTGRLLVADTGWPAYGVAAEICRLVCEDDPSALRAPVVSLGMQPAPCPTAKSLEDLYYPNLARFTDAIATLVRGRRNHGIPLAKEDSMADVYRRFKGPF